MHPRNRNFRVTTIVALTFLLAFGFACSRGQADEAASQAAVAKPATQPAAKPAAPAAAAQGAADASKMDEIMQPDQIPAVVAHVDGQDVTKEDLLADATEARGALVQHGYPPPKPTRGFFRQILDDIIGNRLLFRELKSQGKAATADEVGKQMKAIRGSLTDEAFDKALSARGFDRARLEQEVTQTATIDKWIRETVVPSIKVSDQELHQFYDANQDKMIEPEKVHARHILIKVDAKATPEEKAAKRKQIEQIRARIAGGEDFATVAKEVSDDKGSATRGGDLGWFYRGQMVPAFEKAAFTLPPNKLSDIIETQFGYHLIEVVEKQPETKLTFDKVHDRIEGMLKQRKLQAAIKAHVNDLGKQAKIEILL